MNLTQYAINLGLEPDDFKGLMQDTLFTAVVDVNDRARAATAAGIEEQIAFLLNNKMPEDSLKHFIETEGLKKEPPLQAAKRLIRETLKDEGKEFGEFICCMLDEDPKVPQAATNQARACLDTLHSHIIALQNALRALPFRVAAETPFHDTPPPKIKPPFDGHVFAEIPDYGILYTKEDFFATMNQGTLKPGIGEMATATSTFPGLKIRLEDNTSFDSGAWPDWATHVVWYPEEVEEEDRVRLEEEWEEEPATAPCTKEEAYKNGSYVIQVPPNSHGLWTEQDWIRHIDRAGGWTVPIKKEG